MSEQPTKVDDGGQAKDMTLRDFYAGMAMQGMDTPHDYSTGRCNSGVVQRAWVIADAMIAERDRKAPP